MDTRKWLAAGLAGAAFVAGGFVAGAHAETPAAEAVTDAGVAGTLLPETDADTPAFGPGLAHRGHRGPGGHGPGFGIGGELAEELGLDTGALRDAFADGATVAEALEAQGVSAEEAAEAIEAEMAEHLAEAVEDGRLTQDEADERLADADERIASMLESTPGDRDFARNHPFAARGIAEVADLLGLEVDEVADALRDGQSIAEIAEANGTDADDLIDELVDQARERITEWVNAERP